MFSFSLLGLGCEFLHLAKCQPCIGRQLILIFCQAQLALVQGSIQHTTLCPNQEWRKWQFKWTKCPGQSWPPPATSAGIALNTVAIILRYYAGRILAQAIVREIKKALTFKRVLR